MNINLKNYLIKLKENSLNFNKITFTIKRKASKSSCLIFLSKNLENEKNNKISFKNIFINGKNYKEYFFENRDLVKLFFPLNICKDIKNFKFYIFFKVTGGGISSQISACRCSLTKCLSYFFKKYNFIFKEALLFRIDSRNKERRKYGLKKARKSPQYTKR